VPSTLSLPIREPVSLTSVTMVAPPLLENEQPAARRIVPAQLRPAICSSPAGLQR
jgi:hypothetical protein